MLHCTICGCLAHCTLHRLYLAHTHVCGSLCDATGIKRLLLGSTGSQRSLLGSTSSQKSLLGSHWHLKVAIRVHQLPGVAIEEPPRHSAGPNAPGRYSAPTPGIGVAIHSRVVTSARCPAAPPRVTCCASNQSLRASPAPPNAPRRWSLTFRRRAPSRDLRARSPSAQQPAGRPRLTFPSESGPPIAMAPRATAPTSHCASPNASASANLSISDRAIGRESSA